MDEKEVERYQIPATKHRPTDTTGAGDTFMAAFVAAEAEGGFGGEAMRFCVCGSGNCSHKDRGEKYAKERADSGSPRRVRKRTGRKK